MKFFVLNLSHCSEEISNQEKKTIFKDGAVTKGRKTVVALSMLLYITVDRVNDGFD
jgi:hypothetical protein